MKFIAIGTSFCFKAKGEKGFPTFPVPYFIKDRIVVKFNGETWSLPKENFIRMEVEI